jgi:tetratricopeptide (TPR) repeat protein
VFDIQSNWEKPGPLLGKEFLQARRDLKVLLALEPEQRSRTLKGARTRFRGLELARLLVEESEERVQADPDEAYHLADLARQVLNQSPALAADFAPLVLALGAMANARRARGLLRDADVRFEQLRTVVRKWGVTDPGVTARIDELEGSLRKDQRRFAESEELLIRAEVFYRSVGDEEGLIRVLLKLGSARDAQGKPEEAIACVRAALYRIPADRVPRLYLGARYNLTYYLSRVGQLDEAAELLEQDAGLYRDIANPHFQLRVAWLRGDIARSFGEDEGAERSYREAWEGFIARGIGYDAALVGLDLALLYLRQGRTLEVRRLAEEMIPIFQAQDVHREALAALALFQEAARREEVNAELVRRLAQYLQEARSDPGRRFG